jgi:hypothetical protein
MESICKLSFKEEGNYMTEETINRANTIMQNIITLENEIKTLSHMEDNTRAKRECTHRLVLKKLLKKPIKKTAYNYWSSQDLDSINSIVLFDADEVKVLIDYKQEKVKRLKKEIEEL